MSAAWREFKRGKSKKKDVQHFSFSLGDNLLQLRDELVSGRYRHGRYDSFYVSDPKRRHIHKASVRDRVVHQAVFRALYHLFDRSFIYDSYSCRFNKGTHRGVRRLEQFFRKATANHRRTVYVLKRDVVKFFANIDYATLLQLASRKIDDERLLALLEEIIGSFETQPGKGLPLGNVTSQLFANIYLNELDRFIKHKLKARHYIRYCDDFVILHHDEQKLADWESAIRHFVKTQLGLALHDTVSIGKVSRGIDFLGYVALPHHTVVRTSTKRRMLRRVSRTNLSSYLGILSHARAHRLTIETLRRIL